MANIEWLCHSNFSFLQGAAHPAELIDAAINAGYDGLCVTDMDGLYGAARFYLERQKRQRLGKTNPFRLHYGAELHLQKDHDDPIYVQDTLVLVALNKHGYGQLCDCLSAAHKDGKKQAHLPLEALCHRSCSDLVAIQPMRGLIRRPEGQDMSRLKTRYQRLKNHFKDRFYLCISQHDNPAEDIWADTVITLGQELDIPFLISQDSFFATRSQKRLSDIIQAIRLNTSIDACNSHLFINDLRCPLPENSRHKLYKHLPIYDTAIANGRALSKRIRFDLDELRYHYPKEMIPTGQNAQSYLETLTWTHAKGVYGDTLPAKLRQLLRHELTLVETLKIADYFLTVYDIVRWARSQNILCQGRGSAANSAICFVLGITAINPDKFDLLFERFISAERGDPPDIDVDFEHERREEVIQYIYRRYGREKAAMVCNVVTFKAKGAIRFTGKALGVPDPILDRAAKILSSRAYRWGRAADTLDLVREDCEKGGMSCTVPAHTWQHWTDMAQAIRGFPRHLSIHSGGFLISDRPITQLCPQEPATMPGRSVITWCKDDIEGLGFFKIDVLSLGGLTLIRKCLDLIKTHYGKDMSLNSIPQDDPRTYTMISQADTVGTFQIESRAQMSFLPRHKPKNFYDLVVEVAIIRPGPIQGGMIHPYLRRRNGEDPITFPDKRLIPILKRTFGVPIFQEQVMRVAMAVGGFTAGEANELRKNIGAFSMRLDPIFWVNKLADGMRKNGIEETFIDTILNHIKGFSSYGFPESHAASFALLAYATAYLKCHYPAAFFTAILNSQPMGFYAPDTLLKTAQRLGVPVKPICIRDSQWDHQLEAMPKTSKSRYAIRLGFRLIKGLSKGGITAFTQGREQHGGYKTLEACLKHSRLNRTDLTALAAANALQTYGFDRKSALWLAEAAPYADLLTENDAPIPFPKEHPVEQVQLDYQATGTSTGLHPTLLMKTYTWHYNIPKNKLLTADTIRRHTQANKAVLVYGMVVCRQAPPTAKGMMFITLWDETGSFDLVLRPQTYATYRKTIDEHSFLCVFGQLQSDHGARSILVHQVISPVASTGKTLPLKKAKPKPIHQALHHVRNYH